MATRSLITVKGKEGKYKSVYCHNDGYIQNNGKLLQENYNSFEKADALVSHGGMSSLGEKLEKKEGHSFDNPQKGYTVFYHRDRGEDWEDNKPTILETLKEVERQNQEYNYNYIFEDGKWTVNGEDLEHALAGFEDDSEE